MKEVHEYVDDKVRYIRNSDLFFNKIDDEIILMHPKTGDYFVFNPVASHIWELLAEPRSIQNIIQQLVRSYEVEPSLCESETRQYLQDLYEKSFIQES